MAGIEEKRLKEDRLKTKNWKRWGPYLSERQWGTVREDYSADGDWWVLLQDLHGNNIFQSLICIYTLHVFTLNIQTRYFLKASQSLNG